MCCKDILEEATLPRRLSDVSAEWGPLPTVLDMLEAVSVVSADHRWNVALLAVAGGNLVDCEYRICSFYALVYVSLNFGELPLIDAALRHAIAMRQDRNYRCESAFDDADPEFALGALLLMIATSRHLKTVERQPNAEPTVVESLRAGASPALAGVARTLFSRYSAMNPISHRRWQPLLRDFLGTDALIESHLEQVY